MNRWFKRVFALAVVTAFAVAAATAQARPVARTAAVAVCGTGNSMFDAYPAIASYPSAARGGDREPGAWKNPPIEEAPGTGNGSFSATIPVYFHVFTDGGKGYLSRSQLQKQVSILNDGFGGFEGGVYTGFAFTLGGVDYTNNADWFYNLNPGTSVEREAKAATHVGDASTLNIWTTAGPTYLGFATFPSWYKRSPELDGIVLDYNSFLHGAYGTDFSLGKTATHETGHWLGLLHTFQGGCNDKGDYVDDTPYEASPASGCPEGRDTCPEPGYDPIHNYMDYTFDSCYDQFTVGQAQRMQNMYAYFRAGGGNSVGQ